MEQVKRQLKKRVLRKNNIDLVLQKLNKTKQVNYTYIREYASEVKAWADQYATMEKLTKNEHARKSRESFLAGLGFLHV